MTMRLPLGLVAMVVLASPALGQTPNQPKVAPGPSEPDWEVVLRERYGLSMFGDLLNPVVTTAAETPGLFRKAGPGSVTFAPVIALGLETRNRGGWYRPTADAGKPDKKDLWTYTFKNSDEDALTGRTLPKLEPEATTEFDPGDEPFGLWVSNDGLDDGGVFGEPAVVAAVNKRLAAQPYKAMIYPNRDKATGQRVANSYLVGWEYSTNDDFQDVVCRVDNVVLIGEPTLNAARDYSGWRGGIGITFGAPSRDIADVTELGYEIAWGSEDPRAIKTLGISSFRYWNSIVETSLKGAGYDFSAMPEKDEAARLAFDAWMERTYGVKGLSKFATVRYNPKGSYGDVYGAMDLSSDNALVKAVIDRYMRDFDRDGVVRGGIGLDNAGKVPREFLETLTRRLNARGLGIAANGCPDEFLPYIDFFGNEGFPFSIQYARWARDKGLKGIMGEFTLQHLSGGELDAYLKSKLFNNVVFFGYTNGGTAAGARYSAYPSRPDVYEHQRWALRRLVPISRDVQRAGRQADPAAKLASAAAGPDGASAGPPAGVKINAEGKVIEWSQVGGLDRITGRFSNTKPMVVRFGDDPAEGVYLFVDSGRPEEVVCDARKLGLEPDALVFDEFGRGLLEAKRDGETLTFSTLEGPSLVRLADSATLARGLPNRIAASLRLQLAQREFDRELGLSLPRRAWANFCQPAKWDAAEARSGKTSLAVVGGAYAGAMPQWKYFNRQGAAQLVGLNQTKPEPIIARAFAKARDVAASEKIALDTPEARRRHFDAREGRAFALRLYLDYQDGEWPEVHSAEFSPGSHDWEEKIIRVEPSRPVKTAMLLLEFHQPEGAAWFDDLTLKSGDEAAPNLLAAPSFEEDDPIAAAARAIGEDYERQTRALIDSVAAAAKTTPTVETLATIGRQIDDLAASVTTRSLSPYFRRGLRDLDEAREQLALCERLLAARP